MKTPFLVFFFAACVACAQTPDRWTRQIPVNFPTPRSGHAMAYDSAHKQVVLFGGSNGSMLNDTWVWDGTNWTQKFPATNPPARINHAMVYDSAHGQVVMFGGWVNANNPYLLGDTWLWDGTNWTQASPQVSPSARDGFSMVYDSTRNQTVLFGGQDALVNTLNDTWIWNGTSWAKQSPSTSPPARYGSAMAYDSMHGQAVLFGGFTSNSTPPGQNWGDTWAWNGSVWAQLSPVTSPPARSNANVAYDSASGQTLLFGGTTSTTMGDHTVNDTWAWDGSNWTQLLPSTSPSIRLGPAITFDSGHDQVVLVGGYDVYASQFVGDTWTWYTSPPVIPPAITNVVSASAFGGFSSAAPGSWIEIYGTNFGTDTRGWAGSDFNGNNAPTTLDQLSVTVGSQAAFIDYISPTQVNAQLPSNIATGGPLQLTVTNTNGTSAPVNLTVNTLQPGLLASSPFKISGNQYVVAQLPDGNYVLPAGSISGVSSRPAKPGETMVIYGIGFGPVTPNIPAGEIVTQSNQLSANVQVLFGTTPAQLAYEGLAPSFVGLYQFNVVVPNVPNNNVVPLSFTLNGVAGTQTLFTAVQQ